MIMRMGIITTPKIRNSTREITFYQLVFSNCIYVYIYIIRYMSNLVSTKFCSLYSISNHFIAINKSSNVNITNLF